jgi:hypothetical protein
MNAHHGAPMTGRPLDFSNEELLQAALAKLLERMGMSNVQILQGVHEFGKDIVFQWEGPMGEWIPCACVVKNTKITGSANSSSGARTVFNQCSQALDTGYVDGGGRLVRVQRVYVMCPHDIGQGALLSIQGALSRAPGDVEFVCGRRLHALFAKHWPEYLVDEAFAIDAYLDGLKTRISEESSLEALAGMYDLPQATDSELHIYVQPTLAHVYRPFTVGRRLEGCIPNLAELAGEWPQARLSEVLSSIRHCRQLATHLEDWNVWPGQSATFADAMSAMDQTAALLQGAWADAARSKVSDWPAHRPAPLLAKGVPIKLDSRNLDVALEPMRKCLGSVDRGLAKELRMAEDRMSVKGGLTGPKISEVEVLQCMALHECLMSAPRPFFDPGPKRSVALGKGLLLDTEESLLVVGPAGYGKTTFCRWNALRDTESLAADPSQAIPIYVPLHRIARGELADFDAVFLRRMGLSALIDDDIRRGSRKKDPKIRLYLDGLDEIPEVGRRREIVDLVRAALTERKNVQAIFTARDYVTAPWLTWLPRVSLQGFETPEIRELAALWLGDDPAMERRFFDQLAKTHALGAVMATPLLATITILVFKKTKTLPESRIRLYGLFVDLLCGGWNLAKGVARESQLGSEIKTQVLTQIASAAHRKNQKEWGRHQLAQATCMVIKSMSEATFEALEQELLMDGLICRSGDTYYFTHFSFQEYLAAKGLVGDPGGRRLGDVVASLCAGEDWWREVFGFYAGLCGDPQELWAWLQRSIQRRCLDEEGPEASSLLNILTSIYPSFSPDGPFDASILKSR